MYDRESAPTDSQIKKFAYLSPMLNSALSEMREFAKKKQDGIVSAAKIRLLNRLLTDIRELLKNEDSASYLDPLSEEDLPQNSDAVLVLGQYRAVLDSFEARHKKSIEYKSTWITKEWIDANEEVSTDDEYGDEDEDYDDGDEDKDEIEEEKS